MDQLSANRLAIIITNNLINNESLKISDITNESANNLADFISSLSLRLQQSENLGSVDASLLNKIN